MPSKRRRGDPLVTVPVTIPSSLAERLAVFDTEPGAVSAIVVSALNAELFLHELGRDLDRDLQALDAYLAG